MYTTRIDFCGLSMDLHRCYKQRLHLHRRGDTDCGEMVDGWKRVTASKNVGGEISPRRNKPATMTECGINCHGVECAVISDEIKNTREISNDAQQRITVNYPFHDRII